jgi:iron transport multicopper oxidase
MFLLFVVLAIHGVVVEADTKTFTWEMSHINAAPNGVNRSVIGVNEQFPPPTIIVSKNDQVVIQVTNFLDDGESITLHTHGIFQNGTNYYDGVDQVTQWLFPPNFQYLMGSGVAPGQSFEYNFSVGNQTGTYWIHSHIKGQYPNGLRAPFVILDPESPYECDDQLVLSVSDWVRFSRPVYLTIV